MQQSRTRAIQSLKGGRSFSSSAQRPAVSPFKRPAQAGAAKVIKDDVRRPQSTAAATQAQPRARPAPAFNREDYNVSPLKPYRAPEMDHSFVGMTGGEIFHEMMLRQGVKHICTPVFVDSCACRNFNVGTSG
jgi:acetolactate synthase-1/2/3 large subunit